MQTAVHLDPEYRLSLMKRLATFQPDEIGAVTRASESFPMPAGERAEQDDVAQTLHDIGLYSESLRDWQACLTLYSRVLTYPVRDLSIHAGSRYRAGLCHENLGMYGEAVTDYRATLEYGEIWPEVMMEARHRLALLLMAGEEYTEALSLLTCVWEKPPPGVTADGVNFNIARCLVQLKRWHEAAARLESLSSPDALELRAFVEERLANWSSASEFYRRLLQHGEASHAQKTLASSRLAGYTRPR
jgi:tetratricopeptide (TPR) repeat protein